MSETNNLLYLKNVSTYQNTYLFRKIDNRVVRVAVAVAVTTGKQTMRLAIICKAQAQQAHPK